MADPGLIVVLNGAPRSGKSTIAEAVQETLDGVWMKLGVDVVKERMTPAEFQPGIGLRPGGERPDLEPFVELSYAALYESIAAHSRVGFNVVVDVGHHDSYSRPRGFLYHCARRIIGLPALFVGVRCPIETILERRRDSGWDDFTGEASIPEPILRWQREVHIPGIYDLEVDTSVLTPQQCADAIQQTIDNKPKPTAFERLVVSAYEKLSI